MRFNKAPLRDDKITLLTPRRENSIKIKMNKLKENI